MTKFVKPLWQFTTAGLIFALAWAADVSAQENHHPGTAGSGAPQTQSAQPAAKKKKKKSLHKPRGSGGMVGALNGIAEDMDTEAEPEETPKKTVPSNSSNVATMVDSKTGIATTSVNRGDGSRIITKTDRNGKVLSTDLIPPGGKNPAIASTTDPATGITTSVVANPDGSRTISKTQTTQDPDGTKHIVTTDDQGHRTAARLAKEDRQQKIQDSYDTAADLQRKYDAAVARGDMDEARRIMKQQDEFHDASSSLLEFTDEEKKAMEHKQALRDQLAAKIFGADRVQAQAMVDAGLNQDYKDIVSNVTQWASNGSQMQQETKASTRQASLEAVEAEGIRRRAQKLLDDPTTTPEQADIIKNMIKMSDAKLMGADEQLADNSRLTAAGYAIDAATFAVGSGLKLGGAIGKQVLTSTIGEEAATKVASGVAKAAQLDLGQLAAKTTLAGTERVAGQEAAQALASKATAVADKARALASSVADSSAGKVLSRSAGGLSSTTAESKWLKSVVQDAAKGGVVGAGAQVAMTGKVDPESLVKSAVTGGVVSGSVSSAFGAKASEPHAPSGEPAPHVESANPPAHPPVEDQSTQIVHDNQKPTTHPPSEGALAGSQGPNEGAPKPRTVHPDTLANNNPAPAEPPKVASNSADRTKLDSHPGEPPSQPIAPGNDKPRNSSGPTGATPERIRNSVPPEHRPQFDQTMAVVDRLIQQDPRFTNVDRNRVASTASLYATDMTPEAAAAAALNWNAPEGTRITPETLARATGMSNADAQNSVRSGWDRLRMDPGDINNPGHGSAAATSDHTRVLTPAEAARVGSQYNEDTVLDHSIQKPIQRGGSGEDTHVLTPAEAARVGSQYNEDTVVDPNQRPIQSAGSDDTRVLTPAEAGQVGSRYNEDTVVDPNQRPISQRPARSAPPQVASAAAQQPQRNVAKPRIVRPGDPDYAAKPGYQQPAKPPSSQDSVRADSKSSAGNAGKPSSDSARADTRTSIPKPSAPAVGAIEPEHFNPNEPSDGAAAARAPPNRPPEADTFDPTRDDSAGGPTWADQANQAKAGRPGLKTDGKYRKEAFDMTPEKRAEDIANKVKIFNAQQLEDFRVIGRDGKLVYAKSGKPVNTKNGIYVMDVHGNVYVHESPASATIKHSSLAGGRKPAGAGGIVVEDGDVKIMDEATGHYYQNQPVKRVFVVRDELKNQGVDLDKTTFDWGDPKK
jgi:hypothetical protein